MSNLSKHLGELYNPSISDLELDERHGRDRPVIYLDQALAVLEHIHNELLAALPEPQTAEPGAYEARLWYVEGFNRAIGKMEWVITQYCKGEKDEA